MISSQIERELAIYRRFFRTNLEGGKGVQKCGDALRSIRFETPIEKSLTYECVLISYLCIKNVISFFIFVIKLNA